MSDPVPPPEPLHAPPVVAPPPEMPTQPRLVPLEKLPYPLFVRILALITIVAFVIGLVRAPRAIGLGIANERGKKALAAGKFHDAADQFDKVIAAYPDAKDTRLDYAEACLSGGYLKGTYETLNWFEGKKVTQEEEARLSFLESNFTEKIKALEKAETAGKGGKK